MALRNITNYEKDGVLRKKSKYVEKIDKKVLQLIEDMAETMYNGDGVGLAAPQVGILKRIIVIDIGDGLIKLINPQIIEKEGEQRDTEGCLSIPELIGEVIRPYKVIVRGINEHGENVEMKAEGFLARAFCHEIDHLDGISFIDKAVSGTIKNITIQR
ncbi:peptide deformylase [Clostridium oryzae]|nr:peptide deformylase [Clostridium oryzae]